MPIAYSLLLYARDAVRISCQTTCRVHNSAFVLSKVDHIRRPNFYWNWRVDGWNSVALSLSQPRHIWAPLTLDSAIPPVCVVAVRSSAGQLVSRSPGQCRKMWPTIGRWSYIPFPPRPIHLSTSFVMRLWLVAIRCRSSPTFDAHPYTKVQLHRTTRFALRRRYSLWPRLTFWSFEFSLSCSADFGCCVPCARVVLDFLCTVTYFIWGKGWPRHRHNVAEIMAPVFFSVLKIRAILFHWSPFWSLLFLSVCSHIGLSYRPTLRRQFGA